MIIFVIFCQALAVLNRFCQEPEHWEGLVKRSLYQIERTDDWQPIRIQTLWEPSHHSSFYQQFLQKSINYYQNSLKVKRLTQPILANPFFFCIPDKSFLNNQTFKADFVITVKFFNNSDVKYAAMAYPCLDSEESKKSQPITGHMKLNLAYLPDYSSSQLQMILTHELTHALGFTSKLFSSFQNPLKNSSEPLSVLLNKTVREVPRVLFSGETVKKLAQEAFSCDSLEGLELENQGGRGVALSHWERRLMMNDFMNPQIVDGPAVYSDLSLAVLADSGWYSVSFEYSDKIIWGFHKGCQFIQEKCLDHGLPAFEEFCKPDQRETCTFDLEGIGKCEVFLQEELEEAFQYFNDSTGGDFFADFCPVVKGNYFCEENEEENHRENHRVDRGEKKCEDCRCVEGSLGKNSSFEENLPGCFEVFCLGRELLLKVDGQEVLCFEKGQIVQVEGFQGNLICPDIEKICRNFEKKQGFNKFCPGGQCESFAAFFALAAVWIF
jgi:leishmanolysin